MKEVVKSKTVNTVVYQALDGTEFVNKDECRKYEESAKCVLFHKYNKLVVKREHEETIFKTGSYDDIVDIVAPATPSFVYESNPNLFFINV